jgi:hypothetical protein
MTRRLRWSLDLGVGVVLLGVLLLVVVGQAAAAIALPPLPLPPIPPVPPLDETLARLVPTLPPCPVPPLDGGLG